MLKTLLRVGALAAFFSLPLIASSQALPTATGHGQILVGAGATMGRPDFGQDWIGGITVFADYNRWTHIGAEADAHILSLHTPEDLAEDTYEGGPRFYLRRGRYMLYGKALVGYGREIVQNLNDNPGKFNASSFMYSAGGGIDIKFAHHITVRAFDFEYQSWPNFGNHGLSPAIGTVGVAYRFHSQ